MSYNLVGVLNCCFFCLFLPTRWLHDPFRHQLLLLVVRHQRVHDDLHVVPLQRPEHLSLELSGRGHNRVIPHCQEVRSHFILDSSRKLNRVDADLLPFCFLFVVSFCRGTGFGFCNALCKLSAVLGNLIFGSLVGITKAIPILMASSVLVGGGLVGLRLPDTMANVLM